MVYSEKYYSSNQPSKIGKAGYEYAYPEGPEAFSETSYLRNIFLKGIKVPLSRYKKLIRLGWPYAFVVLASSFMPAEISSIALSIEP